MTGELAELREDLERARIELATIEALWHEQGGDWGDLLLEASPAVRDLERRVAAVEAALSSAAGDDPS